jgi:hypothetical protein
MFRVHALRSACDGLLEVMFVTNIFKEDKGEELWTVASIKKEWEPR